ncbi:(Fe-S)-binding protein [Desulforhopalus singaporensis]|uniref:L-lactate dehydrogenase complex protein LldE n=1 Tax=Desulforhopalus singaporensis TaxID=91360 RepID=A0A1H0V3P1_9BACT|nr:(Fe-S)-binding protein [Desulforhopalus singaporensis]SDP72974.1 L-lactate dehydrogenase complex protein LldE [Desulforhopalus singaporensis]
MSKEKVSLFIQCLVDTMFPWAGEAMLTVFNRLGISYRYPEDQTCCGQPAYNSGYRHHARAAAKRFIEIFDDAEVIVCPSGSCVHMVRHHYPELFRDDPAMIKRARAIGERTFEFTQYLVDRLGVTDCGGRFPATVTYHDSCHLSRGLGIKAQPRLLLENVTGVNFIEMVDSDTCCGFGGTFAVNYPEISTAMVDQKIEHILATKAEVVTGCDVSCLMNIKGRLTRRGEDVNVVHIAEILAGTGEERNG